MKKIYFLVKILPIMFCLPLFGTQTYVNTNLSIAFFGTQAEFGDTLRIGPNANINVINEWLISSEHVIIDPAATITGNGLIVFSEPSTFLIGGVAKPSTTVYVDGGGALVDVNVRIDNNRNIELQNSNFYLGRQLNLNIDDGHIILNDQDLILDNNATILNYDENRYIVTNGDGELVKENMITFIYPVGATEGTGLTHDYTPAELTNSGTIDNIGTRVFLGVFEYAIIGRPQVENSINRTWYISETTPGGSDMNVNLQHNDQTEGIEYDTVSPVNGAFVTRYANASPNNAGDTVSNTHWDNMKRASSAPDAMPGTLTTGTSLPDGRLLDRSNFTQLGYFTKATYYWHGRVLPVEIIDFDVVKIKEDALLTWQTATEINNSHFDIERSFDGNNFIKIDEVKGNGNTNKVIEYSYTDNISTLPGGYIYYRLKQIDFNGEYEYTGIKYIQKERDFAKRDIYFYPNPSKNKFILKTNLVEDFKYEVHNSVGKIILNGKINAMEFVDLEEFAAGIYYIHLFKDNIKIKTTSLVLSN